MIRLAILGCGRIGRVHALTLADLPGAGLAAVCDAVPDAAAALSKSANVPVRNADAIIADPEIDAVVVCTPTDTHLDLIEAAAKAGKAIFCEKPIDLSTARIERAIEIVEAAGIPFMTAFNRRFDPHHASLAARLHAGEIGDIETITIISRDPSPPPIDYIRSSGGIFRDMMIHDLDMARFLMREEFVDVQAAGACLIDPEIGAAGDFDTAAVTLRSASGRLVQIQNSRRSAYGYDQRIEVLGSRGMLRTSNVLETQVERAGAEGFAKAPARHFFLERYAEAYRAEMIHFCRCLSEGIDPSPGIRDGLAAQRLADMATEAAAS